MTLGRRALALILTPSGFLLGVWLYLDATREFLAGHGPEIATGMPGEPGSRRGAAQRGASADAPPPAEGCRTAEAGRILRSRPSRIGGRVRKVDGSPVAGARIDAVCYDAVFLGSSRTGRIAIPEGDSMVSADASGAFAMEVPPGRAYELLVSAPGLARRRIGRALPDRFEDVVLHDPVRIEGIVEEEGTGRRVSGAEVTVTDDAGEQTAVSAADGSFLFEEANPPSVLIDVRHRDYEAVSQRIYTVDQGDPIYRVAVRGGSTVTARAVSEETGLPVEDAVFDLSDRISGRLFARSVPAPRGVFSRGGLAAGREYVVAAARPGGPAVFGVVRPEVNCDSVIELCLPDTWVLSGSVRSPAGEPLAGVVLFVEAAGVSNAPAAVESHRGETAVDGGFRVPGLNPHQVYTVTAWHESSALKIVAGVDRASYGAGMDIILARPAVIQGIVLDASGRPVAGALVIVQTPYATANTGGRLFTFTDGGGCYAFRNVPAGLVSVLVAEPQLGTTSAVQVDAQPDVVAPDLALQFDSLLPD